MSFKYIKVAYEKSGERLFVRECRNRTRSVGFKIKEGRLILDIRIFLYVLHRCAVCMCLLECSASLLFGAVGMEQ